MLVVSMCGGREAEDVDKWVWFPVEMAGIMDKPAGPWLVELWNDL